jgi:eukaryotic-like serine/threonine-protein kinase
MTLQTGATLGRYQVEGLIASGGMGDVYRARDLRLNRAVALKVLATSVSADPERLSRFTQEARATALINHPNIVSVYDVGSEDGRPYVVSELLRGETLRMRIARGPMSVLAAVRFADEIAAHHLGVIHRDLKPENVFVTDEGRVKVLDFGLAKCRNETLGLPDDSSKSTQPGTILGTVGYMSPEQVRGSAVDERSDIFSVGVMLYEMLSGTSPFERETPIETLYAILKEGVPPLAGRFGVNEDLDHVVGHCLEKSPNERFQSARDLAFVLQFTLRTTAAAPPALPQRKRSTVKQHIFEALMNLF